MGGAGNFQPSVCTRISSGPTPRTHGASFSSRASRTFGVERRLEARQAGNARATDGERPSGITVGDCNRAEVGEIARRRTPPPGPLPASGEGEIIIDRLIKPHGWSPPSCGLRPSPRECGRTARRDRGRRRFDRGLPEPPRRRRRRIRVEAECRRRARVVEHRQRPISRQLPFRDCGDNRHVEPRTDRQDVERIGDEQMNRRSRSCRPASCRSGRRTDIQSSVSP